MHSVIFVCLGLVVWFVAALFLGSFVGELLAQHSRPATADSEPDPLIDMRRAA